ncbi:MAG: uracil-DNA glycosylase [Actinobacteria bacterium]|nr:uracil-DNA glycosylase [Actinomycetota bacterium]
MGDYDRREKLKEFYLKIKNCKECELSGSRTKFVFGSGSACAQVMFVGEAPGKNEDLQGLPFVGRAGKLLDELLGSIGFDRSDVFIANVLKCRPPGNRDPGIEEINTCKGYLLEQIKIIDPRIICTLGKFSTNLLLNTDKGINTLRGKVFKVDSRSIMPINHPAAVLYAPSRMEILRQDFQKIKRLVDSDSETPACKEDILDLKSETTGDKQSKGEQLGLF